MVMFIENAERVLFFINKIQWDLDLWRLTYPAGYPADCGHPVGPHAGFGADLVVHVTSRFDWRFTSMYNFYYEVRARTNSSWPEISICFSTQQSIALNKVIAQ
jgi:hypothetical protein